MSLTEQSVLRTPGAQLPYETRGSGPLLLLIAGGSGDGSGFTELANDLADQYRVVIYDRRGGGKSTLVDPVEALSADMMSIERHGDDAQALLAALTTEPAYVFGSSAGGLIGLDLITRYPERVRLLVAHEPTAPGVLEAFDESQRRYLATYHREGTLAAMAELAAENAPTSEQREADVELPPSDMQSMQDALARAEMLFKYTVPAILRYRLDLAALASVSRKIMLAGGSASRERATPVYQATAALAQRLGTSVVEFPGHHVSAVTSPHAFADHLREALAGR